jgi:hypothetical protein
LKTVIAFIIFFTLCSNAYSQLKIGVSNISKLSHLEINSVREYVIFDDLLRSLIKFDSNGELAADLAESWEIKDQYKKFVLKIKPNEYFSDHSLITVNDVAKSLQNIMSNPSIIHGDGKKIKRVSILSNTKLEIELFESNPFFLTELSSPEYRIVKLSEKKYKEVDYIPYTKLSDNEFKNLDIIWPTSTISPSEIKNILKNGYYVYNLNLGFSYWLSLNPNTLNTNERVQIKHKLDSILKNSSFFSNNNFSRSRQLFLPYGPGRLTDADIDSINIKLGKDTSHELKKVKILLPKKVQNELLLILKSSFPNLDIHFYSNFSEYSNLIKTSNYDIALVNNDLSSIDLRSSIIVTFNESRPLIWIDKNNKNYVTLLKNIQTEQNTMIRYASIKKLGGKILADVILYPLYYDYGFIFVKNGIDLSLLNKSGAETFSWKVK